MINAEQLKQLHIGAEWVDALNATFERFDIMNPLRQAAFIGQCGHECGNFRILEENLNYRAEALQKLWPKRFDAAKAQACARNPKLIANTVYSSRMGNRDEASGDGFRYCGRGLIQLTGKENYSWFAASIEIPVEQASEYLQTFEGAAQSACWFWENNNLNKWADAGDIEKMTRIINGGTIGLEDRKRHYEHALHVLGA